MKSISESPTVQDKQLLKISTQSNLNFKKKKNKKTFNLFNTYIFKNKTKAIAIRNNYFKILCLKYFDALGKSDSEIVSFEFNEYQFDVHTLHLSFTCFNSFNFRTNVLSLKCRQNFRFFKFRNNICFWQLVLIDFFFTTI